MTEIGLHDALRRPGRDMSSNGITGSTRSASSRLQPGPQQASVLRLVFLSIFIYRSSYDGSKPRYTIKVADVLSLMLLLPRKAALGM